MAFKSKKPEPKVEIKPATPVATVADAIVAPAQEASPHIAAAVAHGEAVLKALTILAPGCGSCRHWHKPQAEGLGRCRRYPPTRGEHPITPSNEACGEFAAR